MRWLILLALVPLTAIAQQKTLLCPTALPGAAYGTCSKEACGIVTKDTEVVLTEVGGKRTYERLSSVPQTGPMFSCAVAPGKWTTRAALGYTPPVPVPPKSAITVVAGPVLNWNAVPTATGYRVYRGTSSGVYGEPVTVTRTSYPLTGLEPGSYFYVVSWLDADGESPKSPEANVIVPALTGPPATLNLTCTDPVVKKVETVTQVSFTCTAQ